MKRLLFIVAILSAQTVFAQSREFDCPASSAMSSVQGEKVLVDVQRNYLDVTGMESHFEQESYLASLDISETSSGTMIFQKPGKMKWSYKEPEPQEFLLKDGTVYLFQPKDNQLVIDEFKKVLLTDLPVSFIMGIGDLSKDFKVLTACKNSDGIVLTLRPLRANGELKELRLLISAASNMTLGGKVIDTGGNVTAVVFKEPKKNPAFTGSEFNTDFPKGIDITDRRRGDG